MTTAIVIISIIVVLLIVRAYRTLVKIQNEATTLVAYLKHAAQGKSSLLDKELTDDEFYKRKYEYLMYACYLLIRFSELIRGKRKTYRFQIIENGTQFGSINNVMIGNFMEKVTDFTKQIVKSMPEPYKSKVENYLSQPYSPDNMNIGKDIEEKLYPKEKHLKVWAQQLRETIVNQCYLYELFNNK